MNMNSIFCDAWISPSNSPQILECGSLALKGCMLLLPNQVCLDPIDWRLCCLNSSLQSGDPGERKGSRVVSD